MSELMKYNAACRALAEARSVDEVKDMLDKTMALQTYARLAKNRQLEADAIEIRIRVERRLGEMLKEAPKNAGAKGRLGGGTRGSKKEPRVDEAPTLAERGISKKLSARAQKAAAIPAATFEAKVADWRDNVKEEEGTIRSDPLSPKAHVANNSGENEWYTPPEYIEAARAVLGEIDCDPASSPAANKIVKARTFFTAEQDGLTQQWGKRVWMNPPYAQPLIAQFCEGLAGRLETGEVEAAAVLVNNATDTAWFHRLLDKAAAACFVKGRVRFLDPQGNPGAPLQGQAVLFFGADSKIASFAKAFGGFGVVLRRV